jgi:hypothetical protein
MSPRVSRRHASFSIGCFITILCCAPLGPAWASHHWWEGDDDAPELLPGQNTVGYGPLDSIGGELHHEDVDLFRIYVNDYADFSASTVGLAFWDTQLFLFDEDGLGVTYNDDDPAGGNAQSVLTGQFLTSNGVYFLAIANDSYPFSASDLIWLPQPYDEERPPDGPGAGDALSGWYKAGSGGSYQIALTGASFGSTAGACCFADGSCQQRQEHECYAMGGEGWFPRFPCDPNPCDRDPIVYYVDDDAPPGGDGLSWSAAFNDLQEALAAALPRDEIRIGAGTYKPDGGTGNRGVSFDLVSHVRVYGGYAGYSASDPDRRVPLLFETILSGEIGVPGDATDNTFQVLTADNVREVYLDGLTITGGYASPSGSYGGGLHVVDGEVTVIDCMFRRNAAGDGGAAIALAWGSQVALQRCRFIENQGVWGCAGGALGVYDGELTALNCLFAGNSAESSGGAVFGYPAADSTVTATFVNCAFVGNRAEGAGGACCFIAGAVGTLVNCIVWDNHAPEDPQISGPATITYCDVQGGWPGAGNINSDPLFLDSDGPDDDPNTFVDNDYHLSAGSPCIDAGDNDAVPEGVDTDLDGAPRFRDDPDTPNSGHGAPPLVDMGPFEYEYPVLIYDGQQRTSYIYGWWHEEPPPPGRRGEGEWTDWDESDDDGLFVSWLSDGKTLGNFSAHSSAGQCSRIRGSTMEVFAIAEGEVCHERERGDVMGGAESETTLEATFHVVRAVDFTLSGEVKADLSRSRSVTGSATVTIYEDDVAIFHESVSGGSTPIDFGATFNPESVYRLWVRAEGAVGEIGLPKGRYTEKYGCGCALALWVAPGPIDCNGNGIPDECDLDCGEPNGPCDVPGCGQSADCNSNSIPDECDISDGASEDCNANDIPDECDILIEHGGYCDPNHATCSTDYDRNGVPDECDPDCNANGVPDACDLDCGTGDCASHPLGCGGSEDCQPNGVPDECDIAAGTSNDYDLNGVPDECDPDCNGNGVPDACDLDCATGDCAAHPLGCGTSFDCQPNDIPDECDIADGTSDDCNGNNEPDECELADGTATDCNGNGQLDECDDISGGDFDADGDVDFDDWGFFGPALAGPDATPTPDDPDCVGVWLQAFDGDADSDLDLADFASFARAYTGPADITTGLVGYWSFDEGSGDTAYDDSDYGHDGTIVGATWCAGCSGTALDFDGSDDWVGLGDPPALDISHPLTVVACVMRETTGRTDTIVSHGHGSFVFYISGSNKVCLATQGGGPGGSVASVSFITDSSPHLVVATYDGTIGRVYIDGQLDNEASMTPEFSASNPVRIGACPSYDERFRGVIDEVRIYNRALTESDVRVLFNLLD